MPRRSLNALAVSSVLSFSAAVFAQTSVPLPRVDLERLELDPAALGTLLVGDGQVLEPGSYRLAVGFHYERAPLLLDVNGSRAGEVVADRLTAHLMAAYGIFPKFDVGAEVPIIAFQRGDDLSGFGVPAPSTGGLSTPWIDGRYQILSSWTSPVDLAAHLGIGVPIGTSSALGNSGFAVEPRLMASTAMQEFLVSAQVSGLLRGQTALGNQQLGSQLGVDVAGAWLGVRYRPELTARVAVPFGGFSPSMELLAGARYPLYPHIELWGIAGPGFGTLPGTPAFRALVGIAFREEPQNPPPPTEKPQPAPIVVKLPPPDPCAAGQQHTPAQCPELDDDQDGIKNADDKCPLEKGVPEYQGCPIPDRDHDGVPDAEDKCPDEAGPKDRQGCPFHDRDKDGIEDSVDACPDEPGPLETRGCPIKDTDGDGVPDHLDNCPKEPGPASNQGCPVQQKQLVIITAEQLKIKDAVYFDTGKATIQKRSNELLNQVSRILNQHSEIPFIRIEGHTDSTGSADFNRKLSQDRASAVRDYLILKGKVSPDRLGAQGFGPDRPIAPNATAKGRQLNRRVEFNIVNPGEPHVIEAVPAPDNPPSDKQRPDAGAHP